MRFRRQPDTCGKALVMFGSSIALYEPPIRVAEEFAMLDVLSGRWTRRISARIISRILRLSKRERDQANAGERKRSLTAIRCCVSTGSTASTVQRCFWPLAERRRCPGPRSAVRCWRDG
jgi:hypothetical protein